MLTDAGLAGFALWRMVAGTVGTAELLAVLVEPPVRWRDVGGALVGAVLDTPRRRGARLLVAELADDPALAPMHDLLAACGFREEARVADLVRDGVDLVILSGP